MALRWLQSLLSCARAQAITLLNVCLAIGGWGDNSGFDEGVKTSSSRERFAKNIASTVDRLGFDCTLTGNILVAMARTISKSRTAKKKNEIKAFPLLLKEIKKYIGRKELSIAVPGLERDMIAYTSAETPRIKESVDFINVVYIAQ
ncbi:glycoside hydrolase superfamily [Fusarium oxysporum f. sp. albedinis]|nr:glycoside hydrolase superfamily [Fusarium oxysporum f. sp. albedinis]